MSFGSESLPGCARAGGVLLACSALLLSLTACAPGMQNVRVDLRPYEAQRATPAASPAKVRLEPVRDARADAVGSLIGERTTIGSVSMGSIDLNPLPTDVMAQLLRAEFTQMGHIVVVAEEQYTVGARLRKFQVTTPATAVYWDINGAIELEMTVTAQGGSRQDARYAATCTDRTYLFPSEGLIGKVVAACVGKIGADLRGDSALTKFMNLR
jgi:uncharacterized lipoprotein YajG